MHKMAQVIDYIIGLGSYIFVPMIMIIIGIAMGLSIRKAIKAGVTVGIGLIGVSIVSTLTAESLSPVINIMVERLNLNLTAIDVGGGPAAAIGFGSALGGILIIVILLVNLLMLALNLTNTMNIDIYNFWYFAITAGFVQILTGNSVLAIMAGVTHAILSLKVADVTAKRVQKVIGIDGIAIPHGFAAASAPLFMVLDKVYDHIPFLNRSKEEKEDKKEQSKTMKFIGSIIGDPLYLGLILGAAFGLIAGYDFKGVMDVTMKTAGIMVLFPTMVKMIVSGLIPISNQAKQFFSNKFKDWAAPLLTKMGEAQGLTLVQQGQEATTMALGNLFIYFPAKIA
ncbi:PTS galactitol transporter subunit IIC [Clostridium sp. Cult3]|nr:PTS galactitol transporter subunit IIC [Clostridium sp. Cult3]